MTKITTAGVFDIAAETYHADDLCPVPTLSASVANTIIGRSPAHARIKHPRLNPDFEPEEKAIWDIGKSAHNMALRQNRWREEIATVDAKDWRTKAAKEARDVAHEAGQHPILRDQYESLNAMVVALENHPQAGLAFTAGKPERTLIWQDEETGAWCKARPDWMPDDPSHPWPDFKTTADAKPEAWDRRFLLDHGGLLRAAWYQEAIKQCCGVENATLFYVVQEVAAPYAITVRVMPNTGPEMQIGRGMMRKALRTWARCLEEDKWPAYELAGVLGLPPWAADRLWADYRDWIPHEQKPEAEPDTTILGGG